MKAQRFISFTLLGSTLLAFGAAQAQETSWSLDADLPVDANVSAGQLDNGLKYYIRELGAGGSASVVCC